MSIGDGGVILQVPSFAQLSLGPLAKAFMNSK
jgi:hypothetical protein